MNGPAAATEEAEVLMHSAAKQWGAHMGLEFTTQNWQIRFVSKLISQLKNKQSGAGDYAASSDEEDDG